MVPKVIHERATSATVSQKARSREPQKAAGAEIQPGGKSRSVAYGTVVFVDRRVWQGSGRARLRLASVDDLPAGGAPKLFQFFAESAGVASPSHALGSVVLQRISEDEVRAVSGHDETAGGPTLRSFVDSFKIEVRDGEIWAHFAKPVPRVDEEAPV
jgi:hypothetical protein